MSIPLKIETFKPLLKTSFKIRFDADNAYDVELIEIEEGNFIPALNHTPFTLTFRGAPNEKIFRQRMYELYSEDLGSLSLFLIPRQPDSKGVYYDSIIN